MNKDFQNQFREVVSKSDLNQVEICKRWRNAHKAPRKPGVRSLEQQLSRWIRHLPKTVEDVISLLDFLGFELRIESRILPQRDPVGIYQNRFRVAVLSTGLTVGEIGAKYAAKYNVKPDLMRVNASRWYKTTPKAGSNLVLLLDCLDCRLVIERS